MKPLCCLALSLLIISTMAQSPRMKVKFIPNDGSREYGPHTPASYRFEAQSEPDSNAPTPADSLKRLPDLMVTYPLQVAAPPSSDSIFLQLKPVIHPEKQSFHYSVFLPSNEANIPSDFQIIMVLTDAGYTPTALGKSTLRMENGNWTHRGEFLVPHGELGMETTIEIHYPPRDTSLAFQTVYLYE